MDTLYAWTARRAGGAITITHSTGKVVGVESIAPGANGELIALTRKWQHRYILALAPRTA